MNRLTINADLGEHTISRHIYGHFAEHLGRCIYGGIYVGEDSPIPNTNGMRNDVVAARYAISTFPTCAGPAAVSLTNIIGWTVSVIKPRARR